MKVVLATPSGIEPFEWRVVLSCGHCWTIRSWFRPVRYDCPVCQLPLAAPTQADGEEM